jgi:zinc protease
MRFDTNKKLANTVAMIGFHQLPLDYLDTFQQKVEQVTAPSVAAAFQRHIDLNRLQTVTVGDSTKAKGEK